MKKNEESTDVEDIFIQNIIEKKEKEFREKEKNKFNIIIIVCHILCSVLITFQLTGVISKELFEINVIELILIIIGASINFAKPIKNARTTLLDIIACMLNLLMLILLIIKIIL